MAEIPSSHRDLFEKKTFAHFATLLPEGTPQVTPVWVDYDPETNHVLVNTARGRQKERNVTRNPKVGIEMTDPDDPYRYLSVQGEVASVSAEGADAHADELAGRYMDLDEYPNRGEEVGERVVIRIRPDTVIAN
ncbi:PPOX class F420-dependent oxidoreductase [Haloarchaeobius iranensis]|uniref:PPOX class probable F420-dependent enzyme n=1 Tax=Haloarchaeobius iranensis TaxID=996166 RepID=A0A1G9TCK3_9EURY|nr:PPOX class F420-dependent oxidoreductase [Haloarchaeobius iranensis]SDM44865.1 PPOX class probable F420-dependent enzyme [Haloarchaeobius iranensis]